jgi:hypothetical protein
MASVSAEQSNQGSMMNKGSFVSGAHSRASMKVLAAAMVTVLAPSVAGAVNLTGWTCEGTCGSSGPNGVVIAPPDGATYGWVATRSDSPTGLALPGVGGSGSPTTGTRIRSPLFTATAGQPLTFYFNYVTSDGAGFADYGWVRLLDASGTQVALLFTARTTTGGNTVPGFSMPVPAATLTPPATPIIAGAPSWIGLGSSSGTCFNTGCGYTGWIQASYTVPTAGSYRVEIGTVNWDDGNFQTGLAFSTITIGGTPIVPPALPTVAVPALSPIGLGAISLALMLGGLGALRHRRRHSQDVDGRDDA